MVDASPLVEFLDELVTDGRNAEGVQVAMTAPGGGFSVARGRGGTMRPLDPSSRLRLYCAGKPLLAWATLSALLDANIDVDAAIGPLLPGCDELPPHVADYSIADLLRHDTSLVFPKGLEVILQSDADAWDSVVKAAWVQDPTFLGYSEVANSLLLARVLERATGEHPQAIVRRQLSRIGLSQTSFGMTSEELKRNLAHTEINVRLGPEGRTPLVADRSAFNLRRFEPAFGANGSAADLMQFWRYLASAHSDPRSPNEHRVARLMIEGHGQERFDLGLGIECSFGLGTMVGLHRHWSNTNVSARSVGHSGFMGVSFGFVDLERDVAVGCNVVGITDPETSAAVLRPQIVNLALEIADR